MKFKEVEFIVHEIEDILSGYTNGGSIDLYHEIIPDGISPKDINEMDFDDVITILKDHYGVYKKNDVIIENTGCVSLITCIDAANAKSMHDIKYHVLYSDGSTNILSIDDIDTCIGKIDEINNVFKTLVKYRHENNAR